MQFTSNLGFLSGVLDASIVNLPMPATPEPAELTFVGPSYVRNIQKSDGWIDVRRYSHLSIAIEPSGGSGTYRLVGRRSAIDSAEADLYPSTSISSYTEIFSGKILKYSHVKLYHSGSNTTNAYITGRTGRILETILEGFVSDYSPDILLDFNQTAGSGSTIPDISGNERNFTANAPFNWRGDTGHLSGTPGRIELLDGAIYSMDTTFAANHSFVIGAKADLTGADGYLFDITPDRLLLGGGTTGAGFYYFDGTYKATPYDLATDNEFLYGLVYESSVAGKVYVNGLPIFTGGAVSVDFDATSEFGLGQRYSDTSQFVAAGDYDGFMLYRNALLTDADMYDIAQRAGAVPSGGHWFRETVRNDLALHNITGTHAPLWETDGVDVMDASGRENHGDYIGSPVLGQPALFPSDELYSIELTGTQAVHIPATHNPSTGFGVYLRFKSTSDGSNRTLFEITNGTARIELSYRNVPDVDLYLQVFDGTTPLSTIFDATVPVGTERQIYLQVDGDGEVSLHMDGVKDAQIGDISALSLPDLSAETWTVGEGTLANVRGFVSLLNIFEKPITDDQAVALTGGVSFAPSGGHFFNEVVDDELGLAGVCEYSFPFWEESGAEVVDISVGRNDASLIGGPSLSVDPIEGKSVYALGLRTTSDHLILATPFDFVTNDWTHRIAFKVDTGTSQTKAHIWGPNESASNYLALRLQNSDVSIANEDGTLAVLSSTVDGEDGATHAAVVRYTSATKTHELWVDGVKVAGSLTTTATSRTGNIYIGNRFRPTDDHLIGDVSLPHLFTEALTDDQCARLSEVTL